MSPSACKKKTEVLSVVCSLSLKQLPQDVKALEEKIVEVVNQAGREFTERFSPPIRSGGWSNAGKNIERSAGEGSIK